eukprot:PhM_4_TR2666/c0_g1_i1/m.71704
MRIQTLYRTLRKQTVWFDQRPLAKAFITLAPSSLWDHDSQKWRPVIVTRAGGGNEDKDNTENTIDVMKLWDGSSFYLPELTKTPSLSTKLAHVFREGGRGEGGGRTAHHIMLRSYFDHLKKLSTVRKIHNDVSHAETPSMLLDQSNVSHIPKLCITQNELLELLEKKSDLCRDDVVGRVLLSHPANLDWTNQSCVVLTDVETMPKSEGGDVLIHGIVVNTCVTLKRMLDWFWRCEMSLEKVKAIGVGMENVPIYDGGPVHRNPCVLHSDKALHDVVTVTLGKRCPEIKCATPTTTTTSSNDNDDAMSILRHAVKTARSTIPSTNISVFDDSSYHSKSTSSVGIHVDFKNGFYLDELQDVFKAQELLLENSKTIPTADADLLTIEKSLSSLNNTTSDKTPSDAPPRIIMNQCTWVKEQLAGELREKWWLSVDKSVKEEDGKTNDLLSSIMSFCGNGETSGGDLCPSNPRYAWHQCMRALGGDYADFARMKLLTAEEMNDALNALMDDGYDVKEVEDDDDDDLLSADGRRLRRRRKASKNNKSPTKIVLQGGTDDDGNDTEVVLMMIEDEDDDDDDNDNDDHNGTGGGKRPQD